MGQWSACGSRTVCSQWLVAEEVRVDGSLSILIVTAELLDREGG